MLKRSHEKAPEYSFENNIFKLKSLITVRSLSQAGLHSDLMSQCAVLMHVLLLLYAVIRYHDAVLCLHLSQISEYTR